MPTISDFRPSLSPHPAAENERLPDGQGPAVVQLEVGGHAPDAGLGGGVAEDLVHEQRAHAAVHVARRALVGDPEGGLADEATFLPPGTASGGARALPAPLTMLNTRCPVDRSSSSDTCSTGRRATASPPHPLNRAATGETIAEAASRLSRVTDQVPLERRTAAGAVVATLVEAMSDHRSDERVAVGGTANLTRFGEGFDTTIRPLLEALEEHVVLLKLLGEAGTGGTVTVRIGGEGPYQELSSTSVVATGYGPGEQALATLGIVGPTRMDYPGTMAAVRAVARYVSRILDEA